MIFKKRFVAKGCITCVLIHVRSLIPRAASRLPARPALAHPPPSLPRRGAPRCRMGLHVPRAPAQAGVTKATVLSTVHLPWLTLMFGKLLARDFLRMSRCALMVYSGPRLLSPRKFLRVSEPQRQGVTGTYSVALLLYRRTLSKNHQPKPMCLINCVAWCCSGLPGSLPCRERTLLCIFKGARRLESESLPTWEADLAGVMYLGGAGFNHDAHRVRHIKC